MVNKQRNVEKTSSIKSKFSNSSSGGSSDLPLIKGEFMIWRIGETCSFTIELGAECAHINALETNLN